MASNRCTVQFIPSVTSPVGCSLRGSVLRLPWAAPAVGSITRVWHTNTREFVKARLNIAPPILLRRQQQEPIGGEAY